MNTKSQTLEEIEDEVLRDIEKPINPYQPYRVEFPFTCTFTIPEDGHNTKVTIETRSEHLHHGNSERDIRLQIEKDHEIDGPLNAKRIMKFVGDNLWEIDPTEVTVEYEPNPIVELASPEEVKTIVEGYLNEN